ncbi:MAG: hypothetical protein ACI96M_002060 [Candidatus Azotimanducaceae bacterium]|jgi:hypothetical protein
MDAGLGMRTCLRLSYTAWKPELRSRLELGWN